MTTITYTCSLCGRTVTFQTGPWLDEAYVDAWIRDHERIQHAGEQAPKGRRDWP